MYSCRHHLVAGLQPVGSDDAASVAQQAYEGYFAAVYFAVGRGVYEYAGFAVFCRTALPGTERLRELSLLQRMVTMVFMPGEGTGRLSVISCRRMV